VLAFNVSKMEAAARRLLLGSRVYSPIRTGYQFLFDRARFDHRLRMRRFHAPFIKKGDLVFDVGAHIGRYSEVFADLGGRVISIEPNPRCCEQLRRLANVRDVRVEHCAAGDVPGKLNLRVCEDSVLSTVADYYELGFVIFWCSFFLLIPASFGGMVAYEDFLLNAYFWLLLGLLFRLPTIALSAQFAADGPAAVPARRWMR
jgi:hypothetical protein